MEKSVKKIREMWASHFPTQPFKNSEELNKTPQQVFENTAQFSKFCEALVDATEEK